jgi:hypothetical protein
MPTREKIAQQQYRPVPPRQSAQPLTSSRQVAKLPRPVQRQTEEDFPDEDEEQEGETNRRMYPVMQRNFQRTPLYYTDASQEQQQAPLPAKKRKHWLFYVGLVVSIMLAGWLLFSMLGSWIQSKIDDFTYGYPRTYQLDQDVGHFGRVSHFLCINLNGEIEIIETQKGHPEVAKIYVVVVLPQDQARLPVTLSFQNIKGYGSLDAIVHYGSAEIPLYNNGTTFQNQPPANK